MLEIQLQIESARAQTAEQERSALIQTLMTTLSKSSGKGKGRKGSSGSGKRNRGQDHRNNVKCCSCGRTGHYGRDCRDNWSEKKATGKGRLNSAESSNWEEGRLERKPQSYRDRRKRRSARDSAKYCLRDEQVQASDASIDEVGALLTEGCCSKGPRRGKEQRVRRWQRPREETTPVRTREEGARDQEGAVLSSFATTETNEQLKKAREWDPKNPRRKQPGIGTQEP